MTATALAAHKKVTLKAVTVKPPLYTMRRIPDLKKHDQGLLNYTWVEAHELAECVNAVMLDAGYYACIHHVRDLFDRFGVVNCAVDGVPLVTWAGELGYQSFGGFPPPEAMEIKLYVPAAWAQNVIKLASEGIVQTLCESRTRTGTCSHGRAAVIDHWDYFGLDSQGMKYRLEFSGMLPKAEVRIGERV